MDNQIVMRIPGMWRSSKALEKSLQKTLQATPAINFKLSNCWLTMPDDKRIELIFSKADEEFPRVFATACRDAPTLGERKVLDNYRAAAILVGDGGSLDHARSMLHAAALLIEAGGAGAFIDNSTLAHGGQMIKQFVESPDVVDSTTYAYTALYQTRDEAYTMGLQALGLPNFNMARSDIGPDGKEMIEMITYMGNPESPRLLAGDLVSGLLGIKYRVEEAEPAIGDAESGPLHNPWGRLRLKHELTLAENVDL